MIRAVQPQRETKEQFDVKRGKRALMPYANSNSLDERAHPCSLVWTLSVRRHIPHYQLSP